MSIRKLYDAKKLDAKRNGSSWFVAFSALYMEPGYNIRDGEINQEQVEAFCQAFMDDEYVPAIGVDITDDGLRVNDGQHRYLGAQEAVKRGKSDLRLEVYDMTGATEGKRVAQMLKANDGTPTSPVSRANAYARMKAEGMTNQQIAEEAARSPSDVANFLALAACPQHLKDMVSAGQMSYVMAIELSREHGEDAESVAAAALEEAAAAGKEKVTKKFVKPKQTDIPDLEEAKPKAKEKPAQQPFSKDRIARMAELASQIEIVNSQADLKAAPDTASMTLRVSAGVWRELQPLIDAYLGE